MILAPILERPRRALPWWRAGGAPAPIAVYQPKGKDTYAASLLDMSGNGNDAYEGVAPTFLPAVGWRFTNAAGTYLFAPVTGRGDYTYIVRYARTGGDSYYLGSRDAFSVLMLSFGFIAGSETADYRAQSANTAIGANSVMGMTDNLWYRDGVLLNTFVAGNFNNGLDVAIGGVSDAGVVTAGDVDIAAVAIYDVALTAPQMIAVELAIMGL